MTDLQISHTSALSATALAATRLLLEDVFRDGFTDHDWAHALGGVHALVWDGEELIGHASVVQRSLLHGGRALRTGYVEGVSVRADRRRNGLGADLLQAVGAVIRGAYDLGALSSTDEARPLYRAHGWTPWEGTCSALTPEGIRRTPHDEGSVLVLPCAVALDVTGELTCDWRDGDVW